MAVFTAEMLEQAEAIKARYPDGRSAMLPLLYMAQSVEGHVSREGMQEIAGILDLTTSQVEAVATFYTMFHTEPVGKYHLELCTNVSCSLCGSESLLRTIEKELGVRAGETTGDGLFTLSEAECLATCGMGPAMQVGDTIHENLTPEKVVELIAELRRKG